MVMLALLGVYAGLKWLFAGMTGWFNLPVHGFGWSQPESLEAAVPWLSELSQAVNKAFIRGSLFLTAMILLETGVRRA